LEGGLAVDVLGIYGVYVFVVYDIIVVNVIAE
jgi:hypothetical protein